MRREDKQVNGRSPIHADPENRVMRHRIIGASNLREQKWRRGEAMACREERESDAGSGTKLVVASLKMRRRCTSVSALNGWMMNLIIFSNPVMYGDQTLWRYMLRKWSWKFWNEPKCQKKTVNRKERREVVVWSINIWKLIAYHKVFQPSIRMTVLCSKLNTCAWWYFTSFRKLLYIML